MLGYYVDNMKKLTFQEFIEQSKFVNEYTYFEQTFACSTVPFKIKHNICGTEFWQKPTDHLRSRCGGCTYCRQRGENNVAWNPDRDKVNLRYKIHTKVKSMVARLFKVTNKKKDSPSEQLLGYTRKDVQNHLLNHPNYAACKNERWQIDHIFPVKAFLDHGIQNPKIINCLDNLRPILAIDNAAKGSKYNEKEFLDWLDAKIKNNDIAAAELIKSYQETLLEYTKPSSIYQSVAKTSKKSKPWLASFSHNSNFYNLGYFSNEIDAAKHVDYYSIQIRGYAPNFPDEDYSNFQPVPHGKHYTEAWGKSKYKGVGRRPNNKWQSRLTLPDGPRVSLGVFDSETEAALNYDYHARIIFGECHLNFPNADLSEFVPQKIKIGKEITRLSRSQVFKIKEQIELGLPDKEIALQFQVCRPTVTNIRNLKIHKKLLQ